MFIDIKRLTDTAVIPSYQTEGAAAVDLHADVNEEIILYPRCNVTISTGICMHIKNPSIVGLIYCRSGNGFKHGIVLRNGTGVIDSDYQGEIKICLHNSSEAGTRPFMISKGDRVAQMIFTQIKGIQFNTVTDFSNQTERGNSGFGSTGK